MSQLLDNAVQQLSRLPGIGKRTAMRLAMHILSMEEINVYAMTDAINEFRGKIHHCKKCGNLSDLEICEICASEQRDRSTICVVEQVSDLLSIEKTQQYNGVYVVLGGVISPMQGIAPSDLNISLLLSKIEEGGVKEVILAISQGVEGETTQFYISNLLKKYPDIVLSTLARGIGFGDELEYVDEYTISHALSFRNVINRENQ